MIWLLLITVGLVYYVSTLEPSVIEVPSIINITSPILEVVTTTPVVKEPEIDIEPVVYLEKPLIKPVSTFLNIA